MNRIDNGVLACIVAALAWLTTGCGAAQVVDEGPLPPDIKTAGLVILPVALIVPEGTSLEVAAQSLQVTRQVLQATDLPLLSIFDFELNKPLDEAHSASFDTDLPAREASVGGDWRQWLVMHVLVTENRATNVRDTVDTRIKDPKKPNTFRQHGVESKVRVEAGLYDTRKGARLAWATHEVDDNPLDFEPGEDPRPGVTTAVKACVERLLEIAPSLRTGQGGRRTRGKGLADSVLAMTTWKVLDGKSYQDTVQNQAAELRDARMMSLWDRFSPGLPAGDVIRASRNRGVLVREALQPLLPGDVVMTVDGHQVDAAHQVDRVLRTCSGRPDGCTVQLVRAGENLTVKLNWPSLPPIPAPTP